MPESFLTTGDQQAYIGTLFIFEAGLLETCPEQVPAEFVPMASPSATPTATMNETLATRAASGRWNPYRSTRRIITGAGLVFVLLMPF
jgi:hypothetical protein